MICGGCNTEVSKLLRHHWFEDDKTVVKEICYVCNRVLGAGEAWDSWEEQLVFLTGYYKKTARVRAEELVLGELQERSSSRKRVSEYLKLHSDIDLVTFLRYAKGWRTRLRNRDHWTQKEDAHFIELRRHPRRNKEEIGAFYDVVVERHSAVLVKGVYERVRKHYELDADLPFIAEFEAYVSRSERVRETQKLLGGGYRKKRYEEQKFLRQYIKALRETSPERYEELMARVLG